MIFDFVDPDGAGAQPATLSKRYLWGEAVDQLLAQEDVSTGVLWALGDNLNTTRDLVDNAGAVQTHYKYDAFGNLKAGEATKTRFLYTSQEYDPDTGLVYYNARRYDPRTGSFVSADPEGFNAGDENLTRYVGNSPTNLADPSGRHGLPLADRTLGAGTTPAPPPATPPSQSHEWVALPNGEMVMAVRRPGESQLEMMHRVHQKREYLNRALQAFASLGILRFVRGQEFIERTLGVLPRVGHPDRMQCFFRLRLQVLRKFVEQVGGLMHPARLRARRGKHLFVRLTEAQVAVADGYFRIDRESALLHVQEQFFPGLFAFTKAFADGDQLFFAVFPGPHDDQDALAILFQANVEVHAIDPDVNVFLVGK